MASPAAPTSNYYPLLWEQTRPEGKSWSDHALKVISQESPVLIAGTDDIAMFCPKYDNLSTDQKANFWGLLISAIVKFESDFDPLSRMKEPSLGKDAVTDRPIYSEGLMQLSYQDALVHPGCDFDWGQDRHLSAKDPRKSILNPLKNLECGIKILGQQVEAFKRIAVTSGAYWEVLKLSGHRQKVQEIAGITQQMSGCR